MAVLLVCSIVVGVNYGAEVGTRLERGGIMAGKGVVRDTLRRCNRVDRHILHGSSCLIMSNHSEERSTEKTRQRRPEEIVVVSKAPCSRKPSNGDKAQQLRFEIVSQEMLLRRGDSLGLGKDKVRPALTMEGVGGSRDH